MTSRLVKVKPLKWDEDPEVSGLFRATTIVGVYRRWGVNWCLGNGMVFQADSPEAAATACQEDYNRIVSSALAA